MTDDRIERLVAKHRAAARATEEEEATRAAEEAARKVEKATAQASEQAEYQAKSKKSLNALKNKLEEITTPYKRTGDLKYFKYSFDRRNQRYYFLVDQFLDFRGQLQDIGREWGASVRLEIIPAGDKYVYNFQVSKYRTYTVGGELNTKTRSERTPWETAAIKDLQNPKTLDPEEVFEDLEELLALAITERREKRDRPIWQKLGF